MTVRVGLIGANGHGRWHRRRIAELAAGGAVRLVGLADPAPVEPAPDAPVFPDHRAMLAAVRPEVVVICTPPHTHLPIALDAVAAGCDLLLEKPPVLSLADHEKLSAAIAAAGRACQVGFQALGSAALARLCTAVAGGELGPITAIATVAAWQRTDAYYRRAGWAGRGGVDGSLVNPLAHAVMQSLAVAAAAGAGDPVRLEAERYRVRPIETDDTAFARITFRGGLLLMAAVTLAAEEFIAGEVIVTGRAGQATLEYPTDRLRLPGTGLDVVPGRVDLLANLLAHRRDRAGTPLLVPLSRTAAFTAFAEALITPGQPPPARLDDRFVAVHGEPPDHVRIIPGITTVLRRSAQSRLLPSELGVAWAPAPRI
ncbi:MAG TPA: Gfo/Idh/MocA family oxidoreductase [Actinoplanes sp.]|nr:Gfo/Idh/MocA family oxidoreductase [Actinoplanes sp.]